MNPNLNTRPLNPSTQRPVIAPADEALVTDARANLTPAQMVERKLVTLMQSTPLTVSRLQSTTPRRALS